MCVKKILVVCGDYVYPPNHGGRVDMWNNICVLHEIGYWIHLICTVKKKPNDEYISKVKEIVQRLDLIPRKNRVIDMLSSRPLQMTSRRGLRMTSLEAQYDFMILEGSYGAEILENPMLKVAHKILRMQNDEAAYFKAMAKAEPSVLRKIYYLSDAKKFSDIDAELMRYVPNILFLSHDEKKRYEKKYPHLNSYFLPASVALKLKQRARNNHTALLIASFFMTNNKEAIKCYFEKIHPQIKLKDYKIIVAGNSRGAGVKWVEKLARPYHNVEIYDSPKDLTSLYDQASVFVNTMMHGAGVKLKTVNAIDEGLPVVSTTTGNEGTGLEPERDIIVTDNPSEFAEKITQVLTDRVIADNLVKNGQRYLRENYDQKKVLRDYLSSFRE